MASLEWSGSLGRWLCVLNVAGATACTVGIPEEERHPLSAIEQRLAKCPAIRTSDPSASACLAATYEGKTPGGEACTVIVGQNGAYQFSSPALQVSRSAPAGTTFSFNHTALDGFNLLSFSVSEPFMLNAASYRFSFEADFGTRVEDSESTLQIELDESGPTSRTAMCIVDI
jgi:hypothetical protein